MRQGGGDGGRQKARAGRSREMTGAGPIKISVSPLLVPYPSLCAFPLLCPHLDGLKDLKRGRLLQMDVGLPGEMEFAGQVA